MLSRSNPLLPRVMVNRIWQHHFGEGIVRSVDDFGVMGQPPTHPELLDFLANEFIKRGWSIKSMHRLMLLSSTYQMSSQNDEAAAKIDPQNKLLQHMPIRRLEAEAIRDSLLAISGRLDKTMYGPSVLPYLTPFMNGRCKPEKSGSLDGDGRRTIYLNVRRNFLSPMLLCFDYPIPATTIATDHSTRSCFECALTELIAWPVRNGIRTVAPIAPHASANDHATGTRYGRRKASNRQKILMLHKG